jgi:hypothetical protein
MAWHLTEADDPERALPYAMQAGDDAHAVAALSEAELHYRTAVELAREIEDRDREGDSLV